MVTNLVQKHDSVVNLVKLNNNGHRHCKNSASKTYDAEQSHTAQQFRSEHGNCQPSTEPVGHLYKAVQNETQP